MKRTLLAAALAIVALGASAQTQEVARAQGDGFGFINKNLTTEGKVIPYSSVGADYYGSTKPTEAEFTIYDDAFNQVKSFTYPFQEFTYKMIPMVGLADITKETEMEDEGYIHDFMEVGNVTFETLDAFKEFVLGSTYMPNAEFFIDHNGNFAFYQKNEEWRRYGGKIYYNGKYVPTIEQKYCYYDKDDKVIYNADSYFALEIDLASVNFQQEEGAESEEITMRERFDSPYLVDYDFGCNEDTEATLSQNLFNSDDKFEFVIESYMQVAAPTDEALDMEDIEVTGLVDGKLEVRKYVQDKYYESYTKVVNEDGKVLISLPYFNFDKGSDLYRLNGKVYISGYERNPGEERGSYVIYLLDTSGSNTSITELARTKQAPNPKFFNLQGMKVNKDTKGIVIQKGGAKYLNK